MNKKKWIIISLIILFLSFCLVVIMEDSIDIEQAESSTRLPRVSIISAKIDTHAGAIKSFAEVKPRWQAIIKSHVAGDVTMITPQALAGERVQKGDVLIRIEDSTYKAKLSDAKRALASAQLDIKEVEHKAALAKADWKRSGLKKAPSDLAMYKPQFALAQAELDAAKSMVKASEQDLSHTEIKAPFSGILTQRLVSTGQTVALDDPLFHILHQDHLDITVSLSAKQWQSLAPDWSSQQAQVKNENGEDIAQASIKRGGGFLDPQIRQYKIFMEIKNTPETNILAGEFVHVELPGRAVEQSLKIPESAYTREGKVWYVDKQNQLRNFDSDILFYEDDHLIVTSPHKTETGSTLNIATMPLASFIAGREVDPVDTNNAEGP